MLLVTCRGEGNTQGWFGARGSRPAMCSRGLCLRLACRAGRSGHLRLAAERTVGEVSGPGVNVREEKRATPGSHGSWLQHEKQKQGLRCWACRGSAKTLLKWALIWPEPACLQSGLYIRSTIGSLKDNGPWFWARAQSNQQK